VFARLHQRLRNPLSLSEPPPERRPSARHGLVPILVSSLSVTLLVGGVRQLGGLQTLELAIYDRFTQQEYANQFAAGKQQSSTRPKTGADPASPDPIHDFTDSRLLVVGITQEDVEAQEQWPLSDGTVAKVLSILQDNGAAAIGLDLYRDVLHAPGTEALSAQLQQPNVFAIKKLSDDFEKESVSAHPASPPEQVGFNDFAVDRDNVVRRQLVLISNGKTTHVSLSLLLSQYYLHNLPAATATATGISQDRLPLNSDISADDWSFSLGEHYFPSLHSNAGGYQDIDDAGWQILLNYQGGSRIAQTLTLTDILEQRFDPSVVRDRIVLIGNVAASSKDLLETPYSSSRDAELYTMPGVIIHAQMVSQLLRHVLDDDAISSFWSEPAEWLWALAWAIAGGGLAWFFKHPLSYGSAGLLSITSLSGLGWSLFTQCVWVPIIFPASAFVATGTCLLAYKEFFRSFYDPLTGLPNRDRFIQLLEQSMLQRRRSNVPSGENESTAVMFLDLDRFKDINASLGHYHGDQLLLNVTRRLKQSLPKHSHLARLGGDEFGILLSTVQSANQAQAIADDLQRSLSNPMRLQGQDVFTSASVGIALASVKGQYAAEILLRDAHTATYRAKSQGKARHEVFSKGMRTQVVERFQLERDLHRALEQQELFLLYQPFVELQTQRVIGFEALVRWQHPERGLISPAEFIPMAESSGLIIPIGQWILRVACQQMQAWQSQLNNRQLVISVNLSSEQFTEQDLAEQIGSVIQATGLEPASLKLELTESMMMGDVEQAIQMLLNLKQLGVKLGLDDFGTGYSSLSYLHRFPIDTLKIDLSFVRHMSEASENAAIVKTIIELGHNLSMDVIAEGVEQSDQAAALRDLACEIGQGYFFGKPLATKDATQMLLQPPAWDY